MILSAALVLSACGATAQNPDRSMPDWMSGYWLACEGGETAENWIGAGRDMLLGTNLSGGGYEFLRIAANERGEIVYYSMPGGRSPPTEFVLTGHADQRAVFENPAHDFPKRIIYDRDGDVMVARIDGGEGSVQAMEWRFQRAEPDARCTS
jgi:hypothetical protein